MFNTLTGAFCVVNETVKALIKEHDCDAEPNQEESRKIVEQLHSLGFLIDDDIDELELIELRRNLTRFNNKSLYVTIGPTLSCNMRCPYCFESEQNGSMTSETADKLFKFIQDQIIAENIVSVRISWYGGEPLLEMERISQISNALIPFCDKREVMYNAEITTNGYLLTRENAQLLRKYRVADAQVTIDGLEKTHNARRKLKSGQDSFWTIVNNIQNVKDLIHINIRINVDRNNLNEIDKLTDFFIYEQKWGKDVHFYIARVEKNTSACKVDLDECLKIDDFSLLHQRVTEKMLTNGITCVLNNEYPRFQAVGCGAICKNYYVVDAHGLIYTCWNHFGDKSKSIGSIFEPEKITLSGRYLHWMNVHISNKCKKCVYLPICQGGCPDQRMNNSGVPVCFHSALTYIDSLKLNYMHQIKEREAHNKV